MSDAAVSAPRGMTREPDPDHAKMLVEGLNVYYGAARALNDVRLVILPHCITALIGPSGCG